jgi:flagellar basal-body rod protein FlgB
MIQKDYEVMKLLFSNTISILEKGLDYSSVKQKVISSNIANVDTPNYKAKDVNFSAFFAQEKAKVIEAKRTNIRHIPFQSSSGNLSIVNRKNVQYNHNGNSVDLDKEMADLATNQIYYNALTERINGKFQTLQTVIKGGK